MTPRSTFIIAALGLVACNSDEGVIKDTFVPGDTLGGDVVETVGNEVSPEVATEVEAETEIVAPPRGRLVINEVDCQAAPEEWVELVNVGDADVELRGYRLADAPNKRGLHLAPGTLPPGGHVVARGAIGIACASDQVLLLDGPTIADTAPVREGDPSTTTWGRIPDGTGAFTVTLPTPQKANREAVDDRASLFVSDGPMPIIDFYVSPESEQLLENDALPFAPALFAWTDARGTSAPLNVDIRRKGSITLRPWSAKPSIKVSFQRHDTPGDHAFRGVKRLSLHNLAYDPSVIREWLSYEIMRGMGQAAPRVGWAVVRVNGTNKGLYAVIETYDDVFLADWFPSTVALYEGESDFNSGGLSAFETDIGDDMGPLVALAARVDALGSGLGDGFGGPVPPGQQVAAVATIPEIDWRQLATMFALEDLLQHTDGMRSACHNYFMHVDLDGRWSFLPWSVDLALLPGYGAAGPLGNCNQLARICDADVQCRAWFERARDGAAQLVLRTDFRTPATAIAARAQAHAVPTDEPWSGGGFIGDGLPPFNLALAAEVAVDLASERARAIRCATGVAQGEPLPDDDEGCVLFATGESGTKPK